MRIGDSLGGGIAVADWLNSGLTKESRYRTCYNRGLGYMIHRDTHDFTFDERDGIATPADIHDAVDEACALLQSVFNREGNCRGFGYTEDYQALVLSGN